MGSIQRDLPVTLMASWPEQASVSGPWGCAAASWRRRLPREGCKPLRRVEVAVGSRYDGGSTWAPLFLVFARRRGSESDQSRPAVGTAHRGLMDVPALVVQGGGYRTRLGVVQFGVRSGVFGPGSSSSYRQRRFRWRAVASVPSCEISIPKAAIVWGEMTLAKVFPLLMKAATASFPSPMGM